MHYNAIMGQRTGTGTVYSFEFKRYKHIIDHNINYWGTGYAIFAISPDIIKILIS